MFITSGAYWDTLQDMGQQLQSLRWEGPGLWRTLWKIMKKQSVQKDGKVLEKCEQLNPRRSRKENSAAKEGNIFNLKEMNMREEYNEYNVNKIMKWKPLPKMRNNLSRERMIQRKIEEAIISHPWPVMQGPFNVPIGTKKGDGYCDMLGIVQTFRSWTTYQHTDDSACQKWSVTPDTYPENKTEMRKAAEEKWRWQVNEFEESDIEVRKLAGPAQESSMGVHYYPCDRGGCWIECQCKLCSGPNWHNHFNDLLCNMGKSDGESDDEDQKTTLGESPIEEDICYKCRGQCRKHNVSLRRNFDPKVHSITVSRSGYHCTGGKEYYKHEGIPQSCNHCQEDLLDHQMFHKIIHRQCKFCEQHTVEMHDAKTRNHYIHNYNWLYFDLEPKTCQYCYKMLKSAKNRRQHELKMHENKRLFACEECGRKFSAKVSLEYHQTVKCTGRNPFSCKNCTMKFINYSDYRIHRRAEKGIKEPVPNKECKICKKSISRDHLRRHMREVHGLADVKFMHLCTMCDEKFTRKDTLECHIRMTHENNCYQCTLCDDKFNKKDNLDRHIRVKHENKYYQCTMCAEEFTRKDAMHRHLKDKHDNLEFSCPECKVKFTRRDTIKQHIKEKHSDKKEYKCTRPNCDKKFGRRGNQMQHSEKCVK